MPYPKPLQKDQQIAYLAAIVLKISRIASGFVLSLKLAKTVLH